MKKSFVLYLDQYEPIKDLSDSQKGQLLDAMFRYHNDIKFELSDPFVKMAFSFFKETFKRDSDKYLKRCEKNRENVRKRWNRDNTTVYDGIQSDTKHTDSDSDTIVIDDSDNIISVPLNDGSFFTPDEKYIKQLKDTYKHIDIDSEFKSIVSWCISNPKKQKTPNGVKRFINGWMLRNNEKQKPKEHPEIFDFLKGIENGN